MKKLVYLLNQRMPTEKAYGVQVANMCGAFAAQGMSVELIVPNRNKRITDNVFSYYGITQTFTVHRVNSLDFYLPGVLDRFAFLFKQWISAWKLVRYALKLQPDVIYTRDESVAWLASWYKSRVIFEAHTFSRKRTVVYRRLKKFGIRIVVISNALKKEFENIGIPSALLCVAPDGVDLERFSITITKEAARQKIGLPVQAAIVMYTGQLFSWKGADVLAQAAQMLPETLFIFVGGMPDDVKSFQKRFGNQHNIRIVGQRPYDEIPMYLKAADVLVLPNTSEKAISKSYTSPLKLFEYMASGRPIVASDLPSIREILDEHNAFLVRPDDPNALAAGISRAFNDPHAVAVAEKARNDVEQYTWKKRAASILAFSGRRLVAMLTHDTDPRGGYGRYASELAKGISQRGYDVLFLKEREDNQPGIVCLRRRLGIFFSAWRVRTYFRQADIIHALDVYPYGIIAWLGNVFLNKPLVLTLQGTYSIAPFHHSKTRWLARHALTASNHRTAISQFTKKAVQNVTGIQDIEVINHGIALEQFEKERKSSDEKFVLSVGALKYRKGYHIAIPAFARAKEKISDLEYIIVGSQRDQSYYQKLKDLSRQLGVSDSIYFQTNISDQELKSLYAQASVFLLASTNDGRHVEGFGLVFLEAAAAGLPVVGTLDNGIEDAVDDGINGILVKQGDIQATANALIAILGNPEQWEAMSQASYAWARKHDLSQTIARYDRVYRHFR